MAGIADRRKYILENISKEGLLKVSELAVTLGVTPTTIRKDLNYLESRGLLYRAYGSALPTASPVMDINLNNKKLINYDNKVKIGKCAASFLEDNDSIIISSGSTLAVFAECIKPKGRLNIVSTAVNVSSFFGESKDVTVMQVGGLLYSNTLSVIGNDAISTLSNIYCSKVFIGVDGIDMNYGVTTGTMEEAEIIRQMIKSSEQTIILADSSKFGNKGFARICGFDQIDMIITDGGFPQEAKKELEEMGVRVIIVW